MIMSSSLFNAPASSDSRPDHSTQTWSFDNIPSIQTSPVPSSFKTQYINTSTSRSTPTTPQPCSPTSKYNTQTQDAHREEEQTPTNVEEDMASLLGGIILRLPTPESEDSEEAEEYAREAREVRAAARRAILNFGGWLDNDESGDYDPRQEGRVMQTANVRKRTVGEATPKRINDGESGRTKTKHSALSARQQGIGLDVILKPTSLKAMLLCATIPDNWPSDHGWNVFTDEGVAFNSDDESTYNLRKRRRVNTAHTIDEDDVTDLTGHPIARGCKGCRDLAERCPLLEPRAKYPCDTCLEEGVDCELNVEPTQKQTCERCKQRRRHCTYNDDGEDHSEPCLACANEGFRCFAGPKPDPTRVRIAADGTPAIVPVRKILKTKRSTTDSSEPRITRYTTCVGCHRAKRRCTLRNRKAELPCKHCLEEGTECLLGSDSQARKTPAPQPQRPTSHAQQHTLVSGISDTLINTTAASANLIRISTKLAHPIYFNQRAPKECLWCKFPLYGLLGGVTKFPLVSLWPDGRGCTEVSGGHVAAGAPKPTNMCGDCTMSRLLVCACGGHVLKLIKESDLVVAKNGKKLLPKWDVRSTMWALKETQPRTEARRQQLDRWCSLCPGLARWECHTEPDMPVERMREERQRIVPKNGCGLRLCDACADAFNVHNGNMDRLIQGLQKMVDAKRAQKHWPRGLRADYDFFGKDSFMVKQCMSGWTEAAFHELSSAHQ